MITISARIKRCFVSLGTTGSMNGPQLDAAVLFSKATTQQLADLDNEVTHNYIYTLALITASLNTVSFLPH